ncbi:hypothetical protein PFICI_11304 [Pestalotiopsis fici W106-1]|uniref:DUF7587 domain-containing protein n=1 Tax=Pestalotiopsis fici (strain W106-1 / CGMCC3.15140) TaxID=1229662 RepID=W3WUA3_PESFW|nr:uncharacterized protein PFICI_11304 [Pestalotiopsis fici W106-1]ETS77430.1 hypothetical protein PFICI_11304 [Pestalotiopsis fici W106-1]
MYYTRAYAESSPRQLVSGKGMSSQPLSRNELLREFECHSVRHNKEPTALVSVSSRIVDTVNRAYELHWDGEPAARVWIVFISEPAHDTGRASAIYPYAAEALAKNCDKKEAKLFQYEFLLEWYIPESLVVHRVSLQTLIDRGLDWYQSINSGLALEYESTDDLRARIAGNMWNIDESYGFWDVGIHLGWFAKLFGARAPVNWIASQLHRDCAHAKVTRNGNYSIRPHGREEDYLVDDFAMKDIDDGIDTVLIDWWFTQDEFIIDWEAFKNENREMERNIDEQIEQWNDTWCYEELDERQKAAGDRARIKLCNQFDQQRAALEEKAVKMGF